MKLIVDGQGGDNAPRDILRGCALALKQYDDIEILLTGEREILEECAAKHDIALDRIELIPSNGVIEIEDDPMLIRSEKSDSSMGMGFRLLGDNAGEAFISAGSTSALAVGSTLLVRRIKGVKRPALAPVLPSSTGCYILLDAGANLECRPDMLMQFGIMGSIYMNKVMKIDNPRVGLVNVGTEPNKGGESLIEAYKLLSDAPINFIGNIEARDLPLGGCDVAVTDGFTGNIILKLKEGMGKLFGAELRDIYSKNTVSKISAVFIAGSLKRFKKKMDYTEYGGAAFLGALKPVIKAHGSSNAIAFKNAIRQAREFVMGRVSDEIKSKI
ncbi:MAG: phosphate acyltransferase PlsX [Oscillospiraceae bacterium]|nr:phosphate acyltransferase PlsX [Oscillospiraceae bacterium]